MHRQIMYMGEERRIMIEKLEKSEAMVKASIENDKRFMMQ